RPSNRRCFGHLGMADQRTLDFDRAETMAGDVDNIVDAAHDPEIAVLVDACIVAGEILMRYAAPVLLLVAFVIAPDSAQHAGPGVADDKPAALVRAHRLAAVVRHFGQDPGQWLRAASRLRRNGAGQRRHHDAARFRLPPSIHDRATLAANHLVVPHPGLGVDAFADRAE